MEIGGYFEFEDYRGEEYHTGCLRINTARNCLKYLIEARNIKKLWISRWNCDAVLSTCRKSGIEIEFYDLDEYFRPIMPCRYTTDDWVYVVNYYGQVPDIRFEHMILDNVQAFFEKPQTGIDTIYTCRKFFGVTDGAYLYTDSRIGRALERDRSYDRIGYLAGRYEADASDFYGAYQKNEELLDSLPLRYMSPFTENILRSIDYDCVRKRREQNFAYLHSRLQGVNLIDIKVPVGPFAYPLRVKNGGRLRKALQAQHIYIAKLWPNVVDSNEGILAEDILPIPCDQRYSMEHMSIVLEKITSFMMQNKTCSL